MLNNFEAHAQTVNLSEGGPIILGTITTSPFDLTFLTNQSRPGTGRLAALVVRPSSSHRIQKDRRSAVTVEVNRDGSSQCEATAVKSLK